MRTTEEISFPADTVLTAESLHTFLCKFWPDNRLVVLRPKNVNSYISGSYSNTGRGGVHKFSKNVTATSNFHGARRVIWSKFHTKDTDIRRQRQTTVATASWRLWFDQPWSTEQLCKQ